MFGNRWLPLAFTTGAALALWALAAANGYAWQLIWLPAAVAGAAWPRHRTAYARQLPSPPPARTRAKGMTRHIGAQ